jgi:chromosome segregation ATPase
MSKDKDNNNKFLEDSTKTSDEKTDRITEENESWIPVDTTQFDQTLEIMSQTLASIDDKMDVENLQLQKLDQLSGIKKQLNRLENTSVTVAETSHNPQQAAEVINKIEEEIHQSSIGHNQQEISELLEKIDILEKKILIIENQSNSSSERFEKIESVINRFEDLENELPNLFKNLFKKKEKIESNEENFNTDKSEIQSERVATAIPKDTANIIEEAEESLEKITNETLVLDGFNESFYKEDKKPKSNNSKYALGMFFIIGIAIVVLFFLNKFQIVNLNFDEIISRGYFLIDLILKKLLFYF